MEKNMIFKLLVLDKNDEVKSKKMSVVYCCL